MPKLKAFLLIVLGVFVATAGPIFLGNVTNIFHTPWSTWEIVVSGGVFGVVTYLIAVVAPVAVRVSPNLKLPEA